MSNAVPRHTVTLLPAGSVFGAEPTQTLLVAGLAAGAAMARSCRNGTCRNCMCRLESGEIVYTIEWPGLSAEEKRAGFVLPCVAQPRSDVVLRRLG